VIQALFGSILPIVGTIGAFGLRFLILKFRVTLQVHTIQQFFGDDVECHYEFLPQTFGFGFFDIPDASEKQVR
jgi:hypothetical protein